MRKTVATIIGCMIALGTMAIPARRHGTLRTDAAGVEKTVYVNGNEWFHYLTDEEGNWLHEESLLPMSETERENCRNTGEQRRRIRRTVQATGVDRLLAPRGPVILVNFTDTMFTHTKEQIIEWATAEDYTQDGATGSILQYFRDNSFGQYCPQLDFYGPVTLSREAVFYGQNYGSADINSHVADMIVEACRLAHDQGADFSQYDYNNDGEVDWVVVIYAGHGEADSYIENTIWPHQYVLTATQKQFKLDGKTINRYCCTNEISWKGGLSGIGVFVHEFSHILGLPDIYSTASGANFKTNGEWDIMDYGCYNNDLVTPPMYSAYERWWMGWLNPTLLNTASTVTLDELNSTHAAAYLTANGNAVTNILNPTPNIFYVLENRQQSGWDAYLPGHGMLVTKIQYSYSKWYSNRVNYSAGDMGIDIIEADGSAPSQAQEGGYGKPGDVYPTGGTSFTQVANYPVTNIAESNGVITFDLNGGGTPTYLDTQQTNSSNEPQKTLRDGQIVILRGGKIYNVMGNEL